MRDDPKRMRHSSWRTGISAFPSLHVAIPVLYCCVAIATGRRWLIGLAATFAVVIFLATIHLGWHYAIDGYAAALGTRLIWWLTGRVDKPVELGVSTDPTSHCDALSPTYPP